MTTETTKLLAESVIVLVDAIEIVAVILPVLGLCLSAALLVREATRTARGACDPSAGFRRASEVPSSTGLSRRAALESAGLCF